MPREIISGIFSQVDLLGLKGAFMTCKTWCVLLKFLEQTLVRDGLSKISDISIIPPELMTYKFYNDCHDLRYADVPASKCYHVDHDVAGCNLYDTMLDNRIGKLAHLSCLMRKHKTCCHVAPVMKKLIYSPCKVAMLVTIDAAKMAERLDFGDVGNTEIVGCDWCILVKFKNGALLYLVARDTLSILGNTTFNTLYTPPHLDILVIANEHASKVSRSGVTGLKYLVDTYRPDVLACLAYYAVSIEDIATTFWILYKAALLKKCDMTTYRGGITTMIPAPIFGEELLRDYSFNARQKNLIDLKARLAPTLDEEKLDPNVPVIFHFGLIEDCFLVWCSLSFVNFFE